MNINEAAAKRVIELVMQGLDALCLSANVVRETCDAQSFDKYQRDIANAVADVGDNILEPIFRQHPELRPWK